jgi:hypothetical protein
MDLPRLSDIRLHRLLCRDLEHLSYDSKGFLGKTERRGASYVMTNWTKNAAVSRPSSLDQEAAALFFTDL